LKFGKLGNKRCGMEPMLCFRLLSVFAKTSIAAEHSLPLEELLIASSHRKTARPQCGKGRANIRKAVHLRRRTNLLFCKKANWYGGEDDAARKFFEKSGLACFSKTFTSGI
jgi:hypothetical protein